MANEENSNDANIKPVHIFVRYKYLTDSDLLWIFYEYKKILREELNKNKIDVKNRKLPLQIIKIKSESPLDIEFIIKITHYLYEIIKITVTLYGFYRILEDVRRKFKEKEEVFRKRQNIIEAKFS